MDSSELRQWDGSQDFACWIAERAGLHPMKDVRQAWHVCGQTLQVEWVLDERFFTVLFVRSGWPTQPARKSLCLGEVFYIVHTGNLRAPDKPTLSRYKMRALLAAGLLPAPPLDVAPLPLHAPPAAVATWNVILNLVTVRLALGDPPDEPMPLVAPWLASWAGADSGVAEPTIRSGKEWLETNGRIVHVDDGPGKFGKPTFLWQITSCRLSRTADAERETR